MKMRRPHRIPLAPRAVTLLRELHRITGNGRFVFPSNRSRERCMSENTINAALRRLGFTKDEMTAHGFRSAASSMLNECGMWNADAIERQLAHVDNDSVRRAYARRLLGRAGPYDGLVGREMHGDAGWRCCSFTARLTTSAIED